MTLLTVKIGLKRLGNDLCLARKRRRIKEELMAERIGVTRATLKRMEQGLPTVSMGTYAAAVFCLSPERFKEFVGILSAENDTLGQTILDMNLPKRIRSGNKTSTTLA